MQQQKKTKRKFSECAFDYFQSGLHDSGSSSLKIAKCRLDNEKVVSVNSNSALFITMNPADKEYRGRQKLPDTLKQLFRPVLMSAPDNTLISEILLFADGFNNAKTWSIKLNIVFELSK